MKIALVAKKGGVGKTTLCLLLYEAFKRAERTVAVRDYDAQGSASKALDAFGGQKESPGQTYDILIIDTPPSLSAPATAAAVTEANIILVPTTPTLSTYGKRMRLPYLPESETRRPKSESYSIAHKRERF